VQNATQLALADIGDRLGMGEIGAFCPPSTSVVSGYDPRSGTDYVNQLFLGHTAGAGSAFGGCLADHAACGQRRHVLHRQRGA
jgi:hypothetical protein